MKLNEG
jgi:hypothetical protein